MLMVTDYALGSFEVTSGKVIITDPCYKFDAAKVVPARNGKWAASVNRNHQNYITDLVVLHEDTNRYLIGSQTLDFTCPVDSGQAGIFDSDMYAQHQGGEYGQMDTFYGQVCHMTCETEKSGGVVTMAGATFGAASTSGYGDGDYEIEGWFQDGQLVGLRICFDREEENDWDDHDEGEY